MPIYEFQCQSCHHVDELLMRFSDPAPSGCSQCGGPVAKLISQSSFALKGSGWYVTDYARKGASSESGSASKPSAPAKTEATPASTPSESPAATTTPASPSSTTPSAAAAN